MKETISKNSPKDVFAHLLTIVALYMIAGSFIALLFQYINLGFPDPLERLYYSGVSGAIRWSMATLIIVFPVFILLSRMLQVDYSENPAKRELRIRKWLVYFTLFAAAIIIIGDLVTLVYNFLGGDLTARFALKVLVVLAVAVKIFWFYLRDLKTGWKLRELKRISLGLSFIVLAAIIAGFFTAGSPFKARQIKSDEQRVNDLQMLQGEIINFWQGKNLLPATLDGLRNDISGFRPPLDPQTGAPYQYSAMGDTNFELCAIFELPSAAIPAYSPAKPYAYPDYQQNWEHGSGRVCFDRTIDPQIYKIEKPVPRP